MSNLYIARLRQRLSSIADKSEDVEKIQGEPYYLPHKNFDTWIQFNLQSFEEEKSIKVLFSLPMINS